MRHLRMVGVCLVAMFAIAAVAAATASAAQPVFKTALVGKFGSTTLEAKSNKNVAEKVVCKKGAATGEFTGPSSYTQTITFTSCLSGTTKCGNVGAETIETASVGAELYYLDPSESTAPGSVSNTLVGTFKCGSETIETSDFLVGTVKNSKTGLSVAYVVKSGKQAARGFYVGGGLQESSYTHLNTEFEANQEEATLKGTESITAVVNAP